jgi:UDP-N-acetylmuramyl pentapeptide phosphotransferase/UDP-N-acetylglucosamine-1-phosphate transferase
LGTALLSALLTWAVREHARRRDLLDHPNERSSHAVPKPRLGGIGIMAAFLTTATVAASLGGGLRRLAPALATTAVISALGLVDDLRPLPARARFAVQVAAALAVVLSSGGAGGLSWLSFLPWPILSVLLVLWLVWLTNLYNFMDGIDGLAGGQAVIAGTAIAVVAFTSGAATTGGLAALLAAACAGFLALNFPPASIFMGDVGSTAIGFFLGMVPLLPDAAPVPIEVVGIALSLFILDATTTLARRIARGERWFEAHRTHLYQRPVALGLPHRKVTLTAYAGMAAVAACAVAYPRAGAAGKAALLAAPVAVFAVLALVVRRLERRRRAVTP